MTDNKSFNVFLTKYSPLIYKLVKKHMFITSYSKAITVQDLMSEAKIGLFKAYDKLKTGTEGNEMSYVYSYVEGYIKNSTRLLSNITDKNFNGMSGDEFMGSFNAGLAEDIANAYGCDVAEVSASQPTFVYDKSFDDAKYNITSQDDELGCYQRKAKAMIEELFGADDVMRTVMLSKLGIGAKKTDETIANEYNTTIAIVRNKFKKGMAIMKKHSEDI